MGAGSAGRNGGGSPTQMAKDKAEKDRIAAAKTKTKFGYTKPKKENKVVNFAKTVLKKTTPGIVYDQIQQGIDDRKANKAKREANVELGLGTDKMSNYTVGQGGTRETGGEASRVQGIEAPPTIIKKTAGGQTVQVTAPTEAELSQSAAADADDIYTRKKKSKARGRSMMTLTSAQGINDNKLTLGKPSLLGS